MPVINKQKNELRIAVTRKRLRLFHFLSSSKVHSASGTVLSNPQTKVKVVGEIRSSIGGDRQDVVRAALAWMASSPAYPKRASIKPYNFTELRTRKDCTTCTIQRSSVNIHNLPVNAP